MIAVFFLIFHFLYLALLAYAVHEIIFKQRWIFLIVFLILFLPTYLSFQSVIYNFTESPVISVFWRVVKELLILLVIGMMVVTSRNNLKTLPRLAPTDWVYGMLLGLTFIFFVLPIGPATFANKLLYVRSIVLPASMYFIGRNMTLTRQDQNILIIALCTMIALTFTVNFFEFSSGIHFQKLIGWMKYNSDILESEPQGYYGLGWNFERGPNSPRFGAFYGNSLEAGASAILLFATSLFLLWYSRHVSNKIIFAIALLMCVFTNYLAFSRAALVGLFSTLFIAAVFFRYYRLILLAFGIVILSAIGVIYFADEVLRNYVIDTLTFRQASSLGHLLEWIQAFDEMLTNPFGIGLATSGNAAGVESDLKVGGESQVLTFGVQMGFLGVALYVSLIISVLRVCYKTFQRATSAEEKFIPFVTALTKFGLLLPIVTTLAENFLFLSYVSWWMAGCTVAMSVRQQEQGNSWNMA